MLKDWSDTIYKWFNELVVMNESIKSINHSLLAFLLSLSQAWLPAKPDLFWFNTRYVKYVYCLCGQLQGYMRQVWMLM